MLGNFDWGVIINRYTGNYMFKALETLEQGVVWNMLKVNSKDTGTTKHFTCVLFRINIKKILPTGLELYLRRRSGVFIIKFEHISHLVLVFLLLTLNM